jgi:NADPH-dependent glutamate synthase beta subunit-like oxidoreductase
MCEEPIDRTTQLPQASITFSDMSWNRTGNWRYLRPRFVRKFSPCNEACPAGNDVEGFLVLAGQGKYSEALTKLLEESPFPGVCGRVCYHPCESACNRNALDGAVSIQGTERFISDQEPASAPIAGQPKKERIAVVGSGPSGLTCAYHLRRLGYRVKVFEKETVLGGMLRLGIPKYRLPRQVLDREIERIINLGIEVQTGCRAGRDVTWEELKSWDAVFLAAGAHQSLSLGIEGEASQGMIAGTAFLRDVNNGLPVSIGKRVAIIGGGNTAVDCARAAIRIGAKPVILYRRTREEMPAIAAEVEEALEEGVEVQWLTSPVAVISRGGQLVGLQCRRNRLAEPDNGGRPRPEPIPDSEFVLDLECVITAVGEAVEPSDLPVQVKMDKAVVWVDSWGRTSVKGLWAGGDVATDPRMVVHAIGAGKRAALSIHAYFRNEDLGQMEDRIRIGSKGSFSMERYLKGDPLGASVLREVVGPENINFDHFDPIKRTPIPYAAPEDRVESFEEVNLGYDERSAQQEALRCFHCGACDLCGICHLFCPDLSIKLGDIPGMNVLDEFHCKGCGICAEECPRSAVIMEKER